MTCPSCLSTSPLTPSSTSSSSHIELLAGPWGSLDFSGFHIYVCGVLHLNSYYSTFGVRFKVSSSLGLSSWWVPLLPAATARVSLLRSCMSPVCVLLTRLWTLPCRNQVFSTEEQGSNAETVGFGVSQTCVWKPNLKEGTWARFLSPQDLCLIRCCKD